MSKGNKEEQKWLLGESLNQYDRSLKEELNKVEKRNREQNHKISALINAFDDDYIKKEEENTNISLDYSKEGMVIVDDIKGNTLINNVKDSNKELVLNGDIDISGYNNITLTEGINGGKVDIALEGNTMVNVCDQEDPVAITKNYEVTTGNHIALQGEYDGKCRPNIYGNTLVSWQGSKDINKGQQVTINKQYETKSIHTLHTTVGDKVYFRIKFTVDEMNTTSAEPKIFTGYSMGYKINVKAFKDCTVGKIEEASTIREHESARTDQTHMDLCIGMYAPMPDDVPAGSAVCKYTMHDYVIYNLTQLFGAGKEPAQEWCDKNLPYLEGMQSSFEDKLITDEKDAHNGKYKVDYKVTGKNKFNGVWNKVANSKQHKSSYIKVNPNSEYILSVSNNYNDVEAEKRFNVNLYDKDKKYINFLITGYLPNNVKINTSSNCEYIQIITRVNNDFAGEYTNIEECNVQIEEGTKTTTYEPYKEYTKTLYLNTPLLEGDTIEQSGNDIVHVHRYGKVVLDGSNYSISRGGTYDSTKYRWVLYKNDNILKNTNNANILINDRYPLSTPIGTWGSDNNYIEGITINSQDTTILLYLDKYKDGSDDSKTSLTTELQQNPLTVVYELQTPTKEVISTNDSLLLDSYVNGHLDVDSVIPIDKVVFESYGTSLKYLSPNTEYTIQFESDSNGKLDALALNSSDVIGNLNIVKGINKFNITTSDKITINYLWTTGIGFNMSKIVVTPKVEQPFGYFKGMKSVGQNDVDGHKIEILSSNGNLCERLEDTHYKVYGGTVSIIEESKNSVIYTTSDWDSGFSYLIGTNGLFKNKRYCISWEKPTNSEGIGVLHDEGLKLLDSDKKQKVIIPFVKTTQFVYEFELPNTFEHGDIIELRFKNGVIDTTNGVCNIRINENNTIEPYVEGKSNKKEILMNEPLRGLPNGVRDKYVMIDGKWYIERNTIQLIMDSTFIQDKKLYHYASTNYPDVIGFSTPNNWFKWNSSLVCDNLVYDGHRNISAGSLISNQEKIFVYDLVFITLNKNKLSSLNEDGFREYLKNNPITLVGQNTTPTYEPIDYNLFEVYSDITHISNNSIIPCNMVIKNSGYNCILKPNTKYTVVTNTQNSISAKIGSTKVDSTNNVFTIITPSTLTDSVLRFSGKGLTTKNIMLLEGDKTNYIPGYFTGMESAFEQELVTDEKDKNYGKYKVNVKVTDGNKENNITFYINKPLKAVGDIKDKIYVKEDKIVVERNIRHKLLTGADNEIWVVHNDSDKSTIEFRYNTGSPFIITDSDLTISDKFIGKSGGNIDRIAWSNDTVYITISRNKLATVNVAGLRQWLSNNNVSVQNQLATPVYEEVECDLSKLMLENYENSSLILNSNIPPTVDVRYKGELPIVSATKELSSNVESTTIDINQNIIPYMCDMDYRIVELQLKNASTQGLEVNVLGLDSEDVLLNNRKANKIFNPSYEMLKRDILSKRYSSDEYKYRLERYLLADKISNEEYNELEELINGR